MKQLVSPLHMHLLMGRRLHRTLPSLSAVLTPEVVSRDTARVKDEHRKQQQSKHYNKRNGSRQLRQLAVNDRVLVWDIDTQTWRIPAIVIQQYHGRSFRVRLVSGTVLRHQLQWRAGAPEDEGTVEEGRRLTRQTLERLLDCSTVVAGTTLQRYQWLINRIRSCLTRINHK